MALQLTMFQGGEGVNAGVGEVEWVVAKDRYKYDQTFDSLNPIDGKVTGAGKYILQYQSCEIVRYLNNVNFTHQITWNE